MTEHFTFGRRNGLRVLQLSLGTGNFGTGWGYGVVPVIGPRSVEQLDDYLAALSIEIDAATYDRLDEVSRVDLGEPYAAPRGGDDAKIRFHPVPAR